MTADQIGGLIWLICILVLFVLCRQTPEERTNNKLQNWKPNKGNCRD